MPVGKIFIWQIKNKPIYKKCTTQLNGYEIFKINLCRIEISVIYYPAIIE